MKFSIVIPVFNGAKFLENCVGSVLSQSCGDVEAIVVDDGSLDGSGEIAEKLARGDRRVKYFRGENVGVTEARRYGIEKAAGDWICFLDVDDTLPRDALKKYSEHSDCAADIIASGETSLTLEEYKAGLMSRKVHPELWGKLFRKSFILEHYPPLDRSIVVGEDQIINLVLACKANILITFPELQYNYNLDNHDSVTKLFRRTEAYETKFQSIFDSLVRPGFAPENDALRNAAYKLKIEGFKTVVT